MINSDLTVLAVVVPDYLLKLLVILTILVLLAFVLFVADKLIKIAASKSGVGENADSFSLFPGKGDLFGNKIAPSAKNQKVISLKKGHDILLEGNVQSSEVVSYKADRYSINPSDLKGMSPIPKVTKAIGEEIKAGEVLFFDKKNPEVKYASPVSGELIAINRGAKRRIVGIEILADKTIVYKESTAPSLTNRDQLVSFLLESGVWGSIIQRPFGVVADHTAVPKNIHVSTFSTAPLAVDSNVAIAGREDSFKKGVEVLKALTSGDVVLGVNASDDNVSPAFTDNVAVKKFFTGKHPVGNVGIQIHHTAPINKGDIVWTVDYQSVATIGELFLTGKFNPERVVTIAGPAVESPKNVKMLQGASLSNILSSSVKGDNVRVINGDALSGTSTTLDGFLGYNDSQITVLNEGDEHELFGWLMPIKPRPSISNTFPNFLMPKYKFDATTNTHGEHRALVVSGQYEKVLPMDIYPQQLVRSVLTNDIEQMEGLGLYEVLPEDLALCEFVCTSKTDVQQIISDGIDTLIEQG